ncbi:hypothetical protein GSI_04629 [Ganoderma sinense ZZ0214-1]|uniref:Uncharacterized protein n=1 Tax=Ganoderma sinense ZZ0214-1 TaxID=1077348 RepID=A0A2G8SHD8_9APHY|nr:hypothetical protein GSI_04629 [Ganoderma sinense ZZ0214-1]
MSTGETPCPHGNFREDPRLAPILVWPEDQSLTRYAASNDDLEYWVTFNKNDANGASQTPRCDPDTMPFSPGPLSSCVNHPEGSMSRGAMPCSQASDLENRATIQSAPTAASGSTTVQVQIPSSAPSSDAFASPFCSPSLASFETMVAGLFPERPSPAHADTVDAMGTNCLPQLWTEQSTSTHCLKPHGLHAVDLGRRSLTQLATNSPELESLSYHGAIPGDHPYLASGKPQSIGAAGRAVSLSIGPASTGGVPSQFTLASEMFYGHAKNAIAGMRL